MRKSITLLILSFLVLSCENWLGEQGMPQGRGEAGEIILVIDSTRWAGDIGKELRQTFRELVEGLPRDEPLFDLRQVIPTNFKGILKNAKNLVLVVPMNDKNSEGQKMRNLFTPRSLDSLRQNQDIFMINKRNLFSTGQHVLFLINHDDQKFEENINQNRDQIRYFFNRIEERRIFEKIYKAREEKMISNRILNDFGVNFRVPYGYRIADSSDDFIWLRQAGQEIDKSIFISYKAYNDVNAFNDGEIIKWRDEICRKYIYGNPDKPDSFILTEMLIPPTFSEVNFNGKYGKKMAGRWKTNSISMGGPFVSYTLVDEDSNRLYYIEGFLYSPGVDQRELMREMDVTLKTFQTSTD
jgi:hypothetical protein